MGDSPPVGWRHANLNDLAEIVSGGTPPRGTRHYWGGTIPWATPTEVSDSRIRNMQSTRESITGAGVAAARLRILPVGSILVTTRATIGAVARTCVPMTTNQGFQNLVPHEETDAGWLLHAIAAARPVLLSLAAGSTFKEVSRVSMRALSLLVPPRHEQQAIAAVLDAVDESIDRSEATIAATELLHQTLAEALLARGVPGWHSEWKRDPRLGTVPACWTVSRLDAVATLQRGLDLPVQRRIEGAVPIYGSNGIVGRHNKPVDSGPGVITGRSGSIGAVYYCDGPYWPLNTTLYVRDFHGAHEGFISLLLKRLRLERFAASTGVPSLNRNFVHPQLVALPPRGEQERIYDTLRTLRERLDAEASTLGALKALKAATREALVSGRVRIGSSRHRRTADVVR